MPKLHALPVTGMKDAIVRLWHIDTMVGGGGAKSYTNYEALVVQQMISQRLKVMQGGRCINDDVTGFKGNAGQDKSVF